MTHPDEGSRRDVPKKPEERATHGFAGSGESASIPRSEDEPRTAVQGFARIVREAAPYMGAAWTLAAALVLGMLAGRWLDGRLGTAPWMTVGGITLGLITGFYGLARVMFSRSPDSTSREDALGEGGDEPDERGGA